MLNTFPEAEFKPNYLNYGAGQNDVKLSHVISTRKAGRNLSDLTFSCTTAEIPRLRSE
jgi:hypothetical protein